jgi:hypothetical protein
VVPKVRFGQSEKNEQAMIPLYPKPSQIKKPPRPAVRIFADGREVCTDTPQGWVEYVKRKKEMWIRQGKICCLAGICPTCPGKLNWADTSFDHEAGRGAGGSKRDDRIEVDGKKINGCCHHWCNAWKASRVIHYNEEDGG